MLATVSHPGLLCFSYIYNVKNMGTRLHLFVHDFINSTLILGLVDTDVPFFSYIDFFPTLQFGE